MATLLPRERVKEIWPETLANRVSSEPLPTFRPGWTLVPRCLTMMLPADRVWPQ